VSERPSLSRSFFAFAVIVVACAGVGVSTQTPSPPTLAPAVRPPAGMIGIGAFTVDRDRNVYFAAGTTDPLFPTTQGAYSRRCGVDGECGRRYYGRAFADIVVVKMGSDGALKLSTFLGGDGQLGARMIALGPDGSIYIAGEFNENRLLGKEPQRLPNANPSVPGCGDTDIFVARLDPNRLSLIYWTCIQGPYKQVGIRLAGFAVDQAGNAIVGGSVFNQEFPLVGATGACRSRTRCSSFVKKLLPNGNVAFSTTLGGSVLDSIWSLAVDAVGNVFVAGSTSSPDFPVADSFQPVQRGPSDAFITKLDRDGRIVFSTFVGGSGTDVAWAVAADRNGDAWIVGDSHSTDFPTTADARRAVSLCAGDQGCANRNPSAFLTRFDSVGRLRYSTLIGPDNFNPNAPGGARLTGVLIGTNGELHLFGLFFPALPLVRPLVTPACPGQCNLNMVITISPLGDVRFASPIPSGNSFLDFGSTNPGSWRMVGPEGALYLVRQATNLAAELIVIGVNQLD